MKSVISTIFSIKFITVYFLVLTVATASTNGSPETSKFAHDDVYRPPACVFYNVERLSNHLQSYRFPGHSRETYETACNLRWKGPECIVKSPPFESNKVTFVNGQSKPIVQKICITGYFFYEKFDVKLYLDHNHLRHSEYHDLYAKLGKNYRHLIRPKKPVILTNLYELNDILPLLYKHKLIPDRFIDAIVRLKVFDFCEFRS